MWARLYIQNIVLVYYVASLTVIKPFLQEVTPSHHQTIQFSTVPYGNHGSAASARVLPDPALEVGRAGRTCTATKPAGPRHSRGRRTDPDKCQAGAVC